MKDRITTYEKVGDINILVKRSEIQSQYPDSTVLLYVLFNKAKMHKLMQFISLKLQIWAMYGVGAMGEKANSV